MLKLADLAAKDTERAKRNHETYKMIYGKVSALITTQHDTGNSSLLYDVPAFVLGRPMFNHAHAVRYVRDKLVKGGFDVEQMGCTLSISWNTGGLHKKKTPKKTPKTPKKTPKKSPTNPPKTDPPKKTTTWLDNTPKVAKTPAKAKTTKVEEPLEVRLKRLHASLHK